MKAQLKNTTVSYTSARNHFYVKRGKGYGATIAGFSTMEEAKKFDEEYKNLEYRFIYNKEGNRGGAYFYKGSNEMFSKDHPYKDNYTFSKIQNN